MQTEMMNTVADNGAANNLEVAATAPLPDAGARQSGFADILGLTGADNSAVQSKTSKSGSVRYCLLPTTGKGRSLKSVTGLTGKELRARHDKELHAFSMKAGVAFNALLASGEYKVNAITDKTSGAKTFNLIPVVAGIVKEVTPENAMEVLAKAKGLTVAELKELLG